MTFGRLDKMVAFVDAADKDKKLNDSEVFVKIGPSACISLKKPHATYIVDDDKEIVKCNMHLIVKR